MTNSYILFAGNRYYPSGGWSDCNGVYGSYELALKAAASISCDWWQIVEVQPSPSSVHDGMYRIVAEGDRG